MKKGDKYYIEVEVINPRPYKDGEIDIKAPWGPRYINPKDLIPINPDLTPDLTVEEVVKALGNHTFKLTGKGTGTFKETERFKNLSELTDLIRKPKRTIKDELNDLVENLKSLIKSKEPIPQKTFELISELKTLLK